MPRTRTPLAAPSPPPPKSSSASFIIAWNTGCLARYTLVTSPLTLSALARLLAVVFNRMVSALRALPATLNTLNRDMFSLLRSSRLLPGDRELHLRYLQIDEIQTRLIAHVVFGKGRLLDRHFHGVAVQR